MRRLVLFAVNDLYTHTQYVIKQTIYTTNWVRADFCQNEMLTEKKKTHQKNLRNFCEHTQSDTFHNHVRREQQHTPATFKKYVLLKALYFDRHSPIFRGVYQPKMCTSPSHVQQVRAGQKGAIIVRQQNRFK